MSLITELPNATSTLRQKENSVSEIKMDDVDERPPWDSTWGTTTNSSSSNGNQQGPWRSKRQHNKLGQYKLGQGKEISKVLVGDPNVEALEARVAERRAADKIRDEKMRKKIHAMLVERRHREAERDKLKKAKAEAAHQAKQEEIRRKHEEHLAAEEARKVRCRKLLKCDMDIIEGKKSVVARLEDRKAELKKKEEEESLAAKLQRHESFATGKDFYEKLHEHQVAVEAKAETDALDRTNRKLDHIAPLPLEYRNKVRDQFLRLESQRKAETELSMTVSQGKRDHMIQYAKVTQKEILPTLHTVPMVIEEVKTVPRESLQAKDRNREGNMAIRSVSPQQISWAHS